MTTPLTASPELSESQADKEETANEAFRRIESGAGFFQIVDKDLTAPPGASADGARYVVGGSATGAWSGHDGDVAYSNGVNASNGWLFRDGAEGLFAWVIDENLLYYHNGAAWATFGATGATLADGDYGDITVSGSGAALTIDNDAVTYAKMQNVSADARILGRASGAGAGDATELTGAQAAAILGTNVKSTESLVIACSDETTAIATGVAKVTFRMPYAFTLSAVRSSVTTAPTGSTLIIDINENTGGGATTILSTKLSIDATEKTSTTAASAAVISDASLADDSEITIDFDQVGSTIAGAGVKVYLIGTRT
jgi:hypothetical protein